MTGRSAVAVAAFAALASASVVFMMASRLAAPAPRGVGAPPGDLGAHAVEFRSDSGSRLHGWFAPGRPERGGIVLLHPVRASRLAMVGRAHFLHRAGYAVLLFDFQAHGESPGEHITFGAREALDARAAIAYARSRLPGAGIGAIGVSLGGAAVLLGPSPVPLSALVLESVYPTVEEAVRNRLAIRVDFAAPLAAPLLMALMRPLLGIDPATLRPIEHIAGVGTPLLVIAGTEDERTPLEESRRLFERAPDPREFWPVEGAAHVDLHRYAGASYETRILAFFDRHL